MHAGDPAMATRTLTAEDQVSLRSLFPDMTLWTPEGRPRLRLCPENLLPLPLLGERATLMRTAGLGGMREGQDALSQEVRTQSENQSSNVQRPFG